MAELLTYFANKRNVEIHLVVLAKYTPYFNLPSSIHIHSPSFAMSYPFLRPLHSVKILLFIRRIVRRIGPVSVLSFGEMYNSLVLISTLFLQYKVFVSDRSQPGRSWGFLHELLRKITYKRAYGIIAQTSTAKEFLLSVIGRGNVRVIGNPIKKLSRHSARREHIVLSVGRMIPSKRHDLLIKLFCRSNNKGWRLCLVGDGPMRRQLEDMVQELDAVDKIVFFGDKDDVEPFYQQAKIFAFTSNSEGFPNALGEAMRAGLACISFNFIAGAEDLIRHEQNGFLIPMDDERLYVTKLNELMQNPDLLHRFGAEAKKHADQFDISIIGEEYYKVLRNDR